MITSSLPDTRYVQDINQQPDPAPRSLDSDFAMEVWHRRKWVATAVFCAALAAAVPASLALPDLYRATATVLVARQQVSEEFVKPSVTTELETRIQTIHQQVMSRAGLTDLIARAGLSPDGGAVSEGVIQRMRGDIQLDLTSVAQSYGRSTIAFALGYSGRDPQTVARVVNTLAALYVEQNTKSRAGQAARTADFLKTQLAEVKTLLDRFEQRESDFRATHAGGLPEQMLVNLAALERLYTKLRLNGEDQQRVLERRDRLDQQLADASGEDAPAGGAPGKSRLSTLRQELLDLRRQYTEEYPEVIRVKKEIARLEQQAADVPAGGRAALSPGVANASGDSAATARLRNVIRDVDGEIKPLKDEEAFLRASIASYEARIENAPKLQQELQQLSGDYESTKERYQTLSKRYEEAELADSLEQGQSVEQFRILDAAIPPKVPAAPNRLRLLILGFLGSLALAFGAVVLTEKIDTSFHSVDELRAFVKVPALATIRLIPTETAARRRRQMLPVMIVVFLLALAAIAAGAHYFALNNEQLLRLAARVGG